MSNNEVELIKSFAEKFDNFLKENLKELPAGTLIYKDANFKFLGYKDELKTTRFIPVFHGLFYVGIYDQSIGGLAVLSK